MTGIRRLWPCALVAAAVLTGAPASGVAAPGEDTPSLNAPHVLKDKKVRLTGGSDNVIRSGPGNTYSIVGVYSDGSEFVVIAKREEWYNVRLSENVTGWVHSSLCKEFDDMSDLEFRPNPRLFSRVGSFGLTGYVGGYAFDRKSNSLVLGGRLGYHVLEYVEVEGSLAWTHIVRPAEIVESLFNLALEEEDFHMLFYAFNANLLLLPGRQMVPFLTAGMGSSIMRGETESTFNYGAGINFFVHQHVAFRFEFRSYRFESDRDNNNLEFIVGNSLYF